MEYVMIIEFNTKENETFFHYCQYTGNEKALDDLETMISNSCFDLCGDFITLKYVSAKIPENIATFQANIRSGEYAQTFQKHNGVFKCPFEFVDNEDCSELIDEYFFGCRIGNYFN